MQRFGSTLATGGPPVLVKLREQGKRLLLRVPFDADNRGWLVQAGKAGWLLRWNKRHRHWECPVSWFEPLATLLVARHGCVWIAQEIDGPHSCDERCMNATGLDCVCGCGGRNHGLGVPRGWGRSVAASGIVQWGSREFACRFMEPRQAGVFTSAGWRHLSLHRH